jgi:GTP cyclohydrolase I
MHAHCSVLGGALFHEAMEDAGGHGMILVRDVGFASTSEHSLLPFYGKCHLAYVPRDGVVLGLSKVARLAAMYARRLQSQTRFTAQLLRGFEAAVRPRGCAILVEARHLADALDMAPRVTSAAGGCFLEADGILLQV